MTAYDIIIKPILSEKSYDGIADKSTSLWSTPTPPRPKSKRGRGNFRS